MSFEKADFCNFGSILPPNFPHAFNYSAIWLTIFFSPTVVPCYKLLSVAARLILPVAVA